MGEFVCKRRAFVPFAIFRKPLLESIEIVLILGGPVRSGAAICRETRSILGVERTPGGMMIRCCGAACGRGVEKLLR